MRGKFLFIGALATMLTIQMTNSISFSRLVNADEEHMIEVEKEEKAYPEKHLILNADGSYGGGSGAPLNGELDHPEAGYWKINDYYNARSYGERTIIHNFAPYQQTIENAGGIACVLMVMNHMGFTDRRIYSEERLVKKYNAINNAEVRKEGVTAEGLKNLLQSYGIFSDANCFPYSRTYQNIRLFIKESLEEDCIVLLPYWSDDGYHWYVCIGMDEYYDVNIYADPFDAFDHYQDGYKVQATGNMINYWLDIERDVTIKSGASKESYTIPCECLKIHCPKGVKLDIAQGEETLEHNDPSKVPEVHLLKNSNGHYGGQMVDPATGTKHWGGSSAEWDNFTDSNSGSYTDSPYFKFNDYYNYKDEGSALFLEGYRAKLQTTASTCGICSTLSALVYYGFEYDETEHTLTNYKQVGEYKLMKQMERDNSITVYNRGVANYEIAKTVKKWGMSIVHSAGYNMTNYLKGSASKVYPTYTKFADTLKTDLKANHPFLLGWKVGGGHWEVIFGFDDMGTSSPYDDVAVFADSSDGNDNLKDGYNTYSGMWAYNHWYNGSFHWNQQGVVFKK